MRRLVAALLYLGLLGKAPASKGVIGFEFGVTAARGAQLTDRGLAMLRGGRFYRQ